MAANHSPGDMPPSLKKMTEFIEKQRKEYEKMWQEADRVTKEWNEQVAKLKQTIPMSELSKAEKETFEYVDKMTKILNEKLKSLIDSPPGSKDPTKPKL